jgi:outer membrane biosynthesis protein TonB
MTPNQMKWLMVLFLLAGEPALAQTGAPVPPSTIIDSTQGARTTCSQMPDYPESAAKMGATGVTELQYMLNVDGKVLSI